MKHSNKYKIFRENDDKNPYLNYQRYLPLGQNRIRYYLLLYCLNATTLSFIRLEIIESKKQII